MRDKLKAVYLLPLHSHELIYGPSQHARLEEFVTFVTPRLDRDTIASAPPALAEAEVAFSGWGCPRLDTDLLDRMPRLRAVFYAAGSVRSLVTDDVWKRGIVIMSSWAANAVPVAEFTVAQVVLGLKRVWHFALGIKRDRKWPRERSMPGAFGSTVGIVSLGMIGRRVCEMLRGYDLDVVVYDPFAAEADVHALGARPVTLDELFAASDVVSLHAPDLPATRGMIQGRHFRMMKPLSSFINTARGAVVREEEMIDVLRERQDITAVLDVTSPEPPREGSPLYDLPNVILTPHIAGSMGHECRRMGEYAVEGFLRWQRGEPMLWQITRERLERLA